MPENWVKIFKNWIESYDAINKLSNNGLMDEEEMLCYRSNLLSDIIITLQSEVEP